jgi:hypothetical protein
MFRGNPRNCPGSSVVVIAPLLGGVAWFGTRRNARSVVVILQRMQRLRIFSVFVEPPVSALFYLPFSFRFFWA